MKSNIGSRVASLLYDTPGVVNYSPKELIEVAEDDYAPIYFNIRHTLAFPEVRKEIANHLKEMIAIDPDYIVGVESGASFYATIVADLLNKPLILLRKNEKRYGDNSRLIGTPPEDGKRIAIIDDVFATGVTATSSISYLKRYKCNLKMYVIFSYGFEEKLGKKLGLEIKSLTNFNEISAHCINKKLFSIKDFNFINQFVSKFDTYI